MKICTICKQEKSFDSFIKTDKVKGGYYYGCKDCRREKARELSSKVKNTPEYKECNSCKQNLKCNSDNFCKNLRRKCGFSEICKKCLSNQFVKIDENQQKICNNCNLSKKITEFYSDITKSFGKSGTCKECETARSKKRSMNVKKVTVVDKVCSDCGIKKLSKEFSTSKTNADGLRGKCRKCVNSCRRIYMKNNPDIKFNMRLKNEYGMTREQYNEELKLSCGMCEICKRKIKLVIDHNHTTGKYRGLICGQCNSAIGFMQDNPDVADRAVSYLRKDLNKNIKIDYSTEELYAMSNV